MYIAIGTYPDGRTARLEYETLDEAIQKVRDWIEADEIDDDGAMFVRYALEVDPPLETKEPHIRFETPPTPHLRLTE